jgi:hypothetical protein
MLKCVCPHGVFELRTVASGELLELSSADPDVTETIKRTNRPYLVLQGNIAALLAAKDHVDVFLYDGAIVRDPEGIITAERENATARTVAVRQGETINARALTAMFKNIIPKIAPAAGES